MIRALVILTLLVGVAIADTGGSMGGGSWGGGGATTSSSSSSSSSSNNNSSNSNSNNNNNNNSNSNSNSNSGNGNGNRSSSSSGDSNLGTPMGAIILGGMLLFLLGYGIYNSRAHRAHERAMRSRRDNVSRVQPRD